MAVLSLSDSMTALERANRTAENSDARRIIEVLAQTDEFLLDAPMMEANERTSNKTVQRTALPRAEHRVYNQGVGNSYSQTKTIQDVVCELSGYSEVDKKLIDEAANPEEFLAGEVSAYIEGMGLQQAEDIAYGTSVNNDNMDGLAVRRSKIDGKLTIDMGGKDATHNTSIYIVKWGLDKAHLIYPKGAAGVGVSRQDLGVCTAEMGNGKKMQVYRNYLTASYGLTIRNPKALIRLANINTETADGADIIKAILAVRHNLAVGDGTIAIYCNSDIMSLMDVATVDKNNVVYTAEDPWGKELIKVRDMRLRQVDSLLSTEAVVL